MLQALVLPGTYHIQCRSVLFQPVCCSEGTSSHRCAIEPLEVGLEVGLVLVPPELVPEPVAVSLPVPELGPGTVAELALAEQLVDLVQRVSMPVAVVPGLMPQAAPGLVVAALEQELALVAEVSAEPAVSKLEAIGPPWVVPVHSMTAPDRTGRVDQLELPEDERPDRSRCRLELAVVAAELE